MVVHTCNPSTQGEFEDSLSYIARLCLKKIVSVKQSISLDQICKIWRLTFLGEKKIPSSRAKTPKPQAKDPKPQKQ
jgi:hypothetical protein